MGPFLLCSASPQRWVLGWWARHGQDMLRGFSQCSPCGKCLISMLWRGSIGLITSSAATQCFLCQTRRGTRLPRCRRSTSWLSACSRPVLRQWVSRRGCCQWERPCRAPSGGVRSAPLRRPRARSLAVGSSSIPCPTCWPRWRSSRPSRGLESRLSKRMRFPWSVRRMTLLTQLTRSSLSPHGEWLYTDALWSCAPTNSSNTTSSESLNQAAPSGRAPSESATSVAQPRDFCFSSASLLVHVRFCSVGPLERKVVSLVGSVSQRGPNRSRALSQKLRYHATHVKFRVNLLACLVVVMTEYCCGRTPAPFTACGWCHCRRTLN